MSHGLLAMLLCTCAIGIDEVRAWPVPHLDLGAHIVAQGEREPEWGELDRAATALQDRAVAAEALEVAIDEEEQLDEAGPNEAGVSAEEQTAAQRQLLREAVAAHRANHERIRTWKGQVEVRDIMPHERFIVRVSDVTFAFDRDSSSWRWHWTLHTAVPPETLGGVRAVFAGIVTDGHFYQPLLTIRRNIFAGRWIIQRSPAESGVRPARNFSAGYFGCFNPMWFFEEIFEETGLPLDESLRLNEDRYESMRITSDGATRVQVDWRRGDEEKQLTLDLSQGGNIIALRRGQRGGGMTMWEYGYVEIGGAWVPDFVVVRRTNSAGDAVVTRQLMWLHQQVNEPLAVDEFSPNNLDVLPGDQIIDGAGNVVGTIPLVAAGPDDRP